MSDEEEVVMSGEESEEEAAKSGAEEEAVEDTKVEEEVEEEEEQPQEELVIKRRPPVKINESGLDEASKEILAESRAEREVMETEIAEMRARNERRKKERLTEERKLASQRNAEDQRRKAEEEDRKRKKDDEERVRREERSVKMAEFEKWKNPEKRNFVISKKEGGEEEEVEEEDEEGKEKKSREQLEAEKKAILAQRLQPLDADGMDFEKLKEKAKELHNQIFRLEGDKYDLKTRWNVSQYDMMELAERARNMNKVGRGGLKRIQMAEDSSDKIQERFAGCPSKVSMYSKYERTKDKRTYVDRRTLYTGPQYSYAAAKIQPQRIVKWDEDTGLPIYEEVAEGGGVEVPVQE